MGTADRFRVSLGAVRVFISTLGSDGDVLPFTRLAPALAARGHAVTVHTWARYRPWFPGGVDFVAAATEVSAEAMREALVEALGMPSPWDQIHRFAELFYGLGGDEAPARATYRRCLEAMAGHDVAICDVLDHLAHAAADTIGLPWLSWASRPPPAAADVPLARTDAALSALVSRVAGRDVAVATFRQRSRWLDLVACSAALAPRARGARDPRIAWTGPWFGAPTSSTQTLPPEVDAFVAGGRTLLVSFGTVPDVAGRTAALVAAAARTRWRALVQIVPPEPVPELGPAGATADVLVHRGRLPYGALLPRVFAVVHHGGAGTLHEVCRAGLPSFAVPHMADQYYWAAAIAEGGLGPAPVPAARLSPGLAITRLAELRYPHFAARARAIAPRLAAEDGVAVTVALLEQLAAQLRAERR